MSSHAKIKFEKDASDRNKRLFREDEDDDFHGDFLSKGYVHTAINNDDPMVYDYIFEDAFREAARICWSLDDFEIVGELGRGGMGNVFEAIHVESGYKVALKELVLGTKYQHLYIKDEWTIHRSLDHPHIVKFYGGFVVLHEPGQESVKAYSKDSTGLENCINDLDLNQYSTSSSSSSNFKDKSYHPRSIYFVLEYCTGGSLAGIINSPTWALTHSEHKVATYARGIMEACCYLHKQGIIHHDLKPDNILVGQDGSIKLADFGIAERCLPGMRIKCCWWGTPRIMAPEILILPFKNKPLRNSGYDTKVDSWSLGIVIYYMLSGGSFPFPEEFQITTMDTAEHKQKSFFLKSVCLPSSLTREFPRKQKVSSRTFCVGTQPAACPWNKHSIIHGFVRIQATRRVTRTRNRQDDAGTEQQRVWPASAP